MKVKVFVSYSHRDGRYVENCEDSLLEYLKGLEMEGVEFWSDRTLVAGENWDEKEDISRVFVGFQKYLYKSAA